MNENEDSLSGVLSAALSEVDAIAELVDDVDGAAGSLERLLNVKRDVVEAFAREHSISAADLCAAAFGFTLSRFTGDTRVLFGIAGADACVSVLPVAIDCADCGAGDFVRKAAAAMRDTRLRDMRVVTRAVFRCLPFELRGEAREEAGFACEGCCGDLDVQVADAGDSLSIRVNHSAAHSRATAERFASAFERVLRGLLAGGLLSEIEVASEEDVAFQNAMNRTEVPLEHEDILGAFAQTLVRVPENVLVTCEDASYTYAQGAAVAMTIADALADAGVGAGKRVAADDAPAGSDVEFGDCAAESDALAGAGVGPQERVAVFVPRSEWYLLCALGVLTAGCAYVPIDDVYPDERISFMLRDTAAAAVLATAATAGRARKLLAGIGSDAAVIEVDALATAPTAGRSQEQQAGIGSNAAIGEVDALEAQPLFNRPFTYAQASPDDDAFIVYTSGTTGEPKGIRITRRGVVNCADWYVSYTGFGEDDVYALYSAFTFDMHMVGFYPCVLTGAALDIVPAGIRLDVDALDEHFTRVGATHTYLPTHLGKEYARRGFESTLRFLLVIGEKLGEFTAPEALGMCESYGPTETLTFTSAIPVNDRISPDCIGRPIFNTKFYVLDSNMNRVPTGAVGQLYISTLQMSNGYLNREAEQRAAFLENPFDGDVPGYGRMYATGDMVRVLPDGTIGFIGRRDTQVKVRGNRVELGEVEACIRAMDCVADVVVQAVDANGTKELCAYVVAGGDMGEGELYQQVIAHVAARKPSYMVPAFVIALDAIPLNTNGKVDVRALPAPDASLLRAAYAPAETDLQQRICIAFEEVLGVPRIGIDDDFIRLGGDSLKAIRMLPALRDAGVTAVAILSERTPRAIAMEAQGSLTAAMNLDAYAGAVRIPLSESQLIMYLDMQANPERSAYILFAPVSIDERYDIHDVDRALDAVFAAHPVLRAHVVTDGEGAYLELGSRPILQDMTGASGEAVAEFLAQPFDMAAGLSRFAFVREGGGLFLAAALSHLVSDGMSQLIFERDFLAALDGAELAHEEAFRAAAAFSEQVKATEAFERARRYFDELLCEADSIAVLVDDIDGSANRFWCGLDVDRRAASAFARENGISMSALLTAAFGYALSRFTGDSRALFTIIDNGRDRFLGAQGAIGAFINRLPVIIDCEGDDPCVFVRQAASAVYGAFSHDFYPLRQLISSYGVKDLPLFQYFPFDAARGVQGEEDALTFGGNESAAVAGRKESALVAGRAKLNPLLPGNINSELSVIVHDGDDGFMLEIEHRARFSDETVRRLVLAFERVLRGLIAGGRLSEIEVTSEEDAAFQEEINRTEAPLEHTDVLDAFAESVERCPENVLVTCEDKSYTYAQGAAIAMAIAGALTDAGVEPGANVAILVPRSEWYLLAALGVLAAGCAYVPMDDAYPDERLVFMLSDISAAAVFVTADTVGRARALLATAGFDAAVIDVGGLRIAADRLRPFAYRKVDPDDTSCILYTSGTTGRPKGSLITRRAILNVSEWYAGYTHMDEGDVYALYTACTFDMHVLGLFPHLFVGASADIVPEAIRLDMHALNEHFSKVGATHTLMTTHVGRAFAELHLESSIRFLLVIGEKLGEFEAPGPLGMCESYGPTESLALVTAIPVNERIAHNSVGRLLSNIRAYVLDAELRRVPVGAVGQLYLSGYQLAKGYLNRPEETAAAFLSNPFDGEKPGYERMYATGDMVRILPDDTLGFIGRRDSQVKVRGNRVELGEVEACIRAMDCVSDVVVRAVDAGGTKELCAYVVAQPELSGAYKNDASQLAGALGMDNGQQPANVQGMDESSLYQIVSAHVAAQKPAYMVPAFVIALDAIPLNVNGKVDARALPKPDALLLRSAYAPAETELQQRIALAFEEALGVSPVGIDDDFIRLGGDSIKAIRVVARLREGRLSVSARDVLQFKTPRRVADTIDISAKQVSCGHIEGSVGLLPIQKWFFKKNGRSDFVQTYCLQARERLDAKLLEQALNALTDAHDMLRAFYSRDAEGNIIQTVRSQGVKAVTFECVDADENCVSDVIDERMAAGIAGLDIYEGRLFYALLVQTESSSYLAMAIHHLVVDGVSWSIVIDDLAKIYSALKRGEVYEPPCLYSYKDWVQAVQTYATAISKKQKAYWESAVKAIGGEHISGPAMGYSLSIPIAFRLNETNDINEHEYLLLAVARAYKKAYRREPAFEMESHGRDESIADANRTVGWFTSKYPLTIPINGGDGTIDVAMDAIAVKRACGSVRSLGIGYGCLAYITSEIVPVRAPITFNYLSDEFSFENELFCLLGSKKGDAFSDGSLKTWREDGDASGIDLNVSKTGALYRVGGTFPQGTYLEEGFSVFAELLINELGSRS